MRDLVLAAYNGAHTIDVLSAGTGDLRPVGNVLRKALSES